MPEDLWISIKEILLEILVEKEVFLVASKQGVRILFEGVLPRLEPSPAHVYHNFLVLGFPTSFALRWRREGVGGDGHPADGSRPGEGQPGGHGGHPPPSRGLEADHLSMPSSLSLLDSLEDQPAS